MPLGGVLWQGQCDVSVNQDAVSAGVLTIYNGGIEVGDPSHGSLLSHVVDYVGGGAEEDMDGHTAIPFKALVCFSAEDSPTQTVVLESPELGSIEFWGLAEPDTVRRLIQLLINLEAGTAGGEQVFLWRKSKERPDIPIATVLRNHATYKEFVESCPGKVGGDGDGGFLEWHVRDAHYGLRTAPKRKPQGALPGLPALPALPTRQKTPLRSAKVYLTSATLWVQRSVATTEPAEEESLAGHRLADIRVFRLVSKSTLAFLLESGDEGTLSVKGEGMQEFYPVFKDAWLLSCHQQAFPDLDDVGGGGGGDAAAAASPGRTRRKRPKMEHRALVNLMRRFHLHFDSLDDKNEGLIREKRFQQAMSPLLQSREFSHYIFRGLLASGKGGAGGITFVNFLQGMCGSIFGGVEEKVKFSFKLFDQNQDGTLDENEFVEAVKVFHSLNPLFLGAVGSSDEDGGGGGDGAAAGAADEPDAVAQFAARLYKQETAKKGGGKLSFEDYANCILSNSTRDPGEVAGIDASVPGGGIGGGSGGGGRAYFSGASGGGVGRFIFFGNDDFELSSRILHGITTSVLTRTGVDIPALQLRVTKCTLAQSDSAATAREHARSARGGASADGPLLSPSAAAGDGGGGTGARGKSPAEERAALVLHLSAERDVSRTFDLSKGRRGEGGAPADADGCWSREEPFLFTDHAPVLFRLLRLKFGIGKTDYLKSLGIDHMVFNLLFGSLATLKQMSSTGSSGSIFFVSHDEKFVVKSLPQSEFESLLDLLPHYLLHAHKYTDMLITKFCGLYSMKVAGKTIHAVAMQNTFTNVAELKQVYDLKGSTVNRSVGKKKMGGLHAMKDLDLNRTIELRWDWRQRLLHQLKVDTAFLEKHDLIDYSFLVGLHTPRRAVHIPPERTVVNAALKSLKVNDKMSSNKQLWKCCVTASAAETPSKDPFVATVEHQVELASGSHSGRRQGAISAAELALLYTPSVFKQQNGGVATACGGEIVQFGLIDILTRYSTQKLMEHRLKRLMYTRLRMSCVPPSQYRSRLLKFLSSVFTDTTDSPSLLRLPSVVPPPGARFRAVSEAGVMVEFVMSGSPQPMFWIVTTTASKGASAAAGDVGIVREKVPLGDVLFSSSLKASVHSLRFVSSDLSQSHVRNEEVVYSLKGSKNAFFSHPLVITTHEHRLYPRSSVYTTDLFTKYRVLATAAHILSSQQRPSAPATTDREDPRRCSLRSEAPMSTLAGSRPIIDLNHSSGQAGGGAGVGVGAGSGSDTGFRLSVGVFTAKTSYSRDCTASLNTYAQHLNDSAATVSAALLCTRYDGLPDDLNDPLGAGGLPEGDDTASHHFSVGYLRSKLERAFYVLQAFGNDTGCMMLVVPYRRRGEFTGARKAHCDGVFAFAAQHHLTPFLCVFTTAPAVDPAAFQSAVRFVSSSLDVGSSALQAFPLVFWAVPPSPPSLHSRPNLFSRFNPVHPAGSHDLHVLCRYRAGAGVGSAGLGMDSADVTEDGEEGAPRVPSHARPISHTTAAPSGYLSEVASVKSSSTGSHGGGGDEAPEATQAAKSFRVPALKPMLFTADGAGAHGAPRAYTATVHGGDDECIVHLSFPMAGLDCFRLVHGRQGLSRTPSQSMGASTNPPVLEGATGGPERPLLLHDTRVSFAFSDVELVMLQCATEVPAARVRQLREKVVLDVSNEFIEPGGVIVGTATDEAAGGSAGGEGGPAALVAWEEFTVTLGDATWRDWNNQVAFIHSVPNLTQQFIDFMLRRDVVVTLCTEANLQKPSRSWVYHASQGAFRLNASASFAVPLFDAGIDTNCVLKGTIRRV